MRISRLIGAALVSASVALLVPAQALACDSGPFPAEPFETGAGEAKALSAPLPAPLGVSARVVHQEATSGHTDTLCGGGDSCGDAAYDAVLLSVTPPAGMAEGEFGYRIRVVRGTAPATLEIERDVAPGWDDLAFPGAGTEALDFTLSVSTIDRFGNESAPVETVVRDAGATRSDEDGGCSTTGNAVAPWVVVLVALSAARLRVRGAQG